MKEKHPEYMAAKVKRDRDEGKAFFRRFAPALLVWLAAVFVLVLYVSADPSIFFGLIASMVAISVWAGLYARRATKMDTIAMESVARECRICGATTDGIQMKQHLEVAHPEELRYLNEARAYAYGVLVGIAALMLFFASLVLPYLGPGRNRGFGQTFAYGSMVMWTAAMVAWRRFVDARHVRHVRRIWDESHGKPWSRP
jgi:hypothetical protein